VAGRRWPAGARIQLSFELSEYNRALDVYAEGPRNRQRITLEGVNPMTFDYLVPSPHRPIELLFFQCMASGEF
jgi:hypothetical protein